MMSRQLYSGFKKYVPIPVTCVFLFWHWDVSHRLCRYAEESQVSALTLEVLAQREAGSGADCFAHSDKRGKCKLALKERSIYLKGTQKMNCFWVSSARFFGSGLGLTQNTEIKVRVPFTSEGPE